MTAWAELDEIERDVMVLASEEGNLWEVCARFGREDNIREAIALPDGQRAVSHLVSLGLVSMYRLSDPEGQISEQELASVFAGPDAWIGPSAPQSGLCLYLTPRGELMYYELPAE